MSSSHTPTELEAQPRPRAEDVDAAGLTHVGKVRRENQDQFLIASLHKTMHIWDTSLPQRSREELSSEPFGGLALVADGVGGSAAGAEASATVVGAVSEYVTRSMDCFRNVDASNEAAFLEVLGAAVTECHQAVLQRAEEDPESKGMATTLTMVYTLWPNAYVIQVGDSRCYQLRVGEFRLLTKDQTVAQQMYDAGAFDTGELNQSPLGNVLYSAVGGSKALPVTSRFDLRWEDTLLLCSDGLTKHVSEEQIKQVLLEMSSAKQACDRLVSLALDGGGTDNVTVVVVRIAAEPR